MELRRKGVLKIFLGKKLQRGLKPAEPCASYAPGIYYSNDFNPAALVPLTYAGWL